ncbi:hypothetical protein MMC10_006137 [Thelotrema lepadinum]|nr:hypothetical protein [Thelotrema lepadinum]
MADFFAKKVATHVLKENAANKFGSEDPYFDYVSPLDMNGNAVGKPKKQKKATPPGLTKKEEKVLKKVTRRAYRLDNCLNICGIRLGWGVVAGIIPGLGDIFDTLCALMVYRTCLAADLPGSLKSRMMLNIMIDFAIGLVPVLGDVADALYRASKLAPLECNAAAVLTLILDTRNASLLYGHLKARGATRIAEDEKITARGTDRRERSQSRGRGGQQTKQRQDQPTTISDRERMQLPAPSASQQQQLTTNNLRKDERHKERTQQPPAEHQQRRFLTADDLDQPEPARVRDDKNGSSARGWVSRLLRGSESTPTQERDVENLDDVPRR